MDHFSYGSLHGLIPSHTAVSLLLQQDTEPLLHLYVYACDDFQLLYVQETIPRTQHVKANGKPRAG